MTKDLDALIDDVTDELARRKEYRRSIKRAAYLNALEAEGYAVVNRDDLRETLAHLDAACRTISGENCTASFVQRLQQQAVAR